MSVTYIKDQTKYLLWGKAAGRCQYAGCNRRIDLNSVTKAEFNTAYIAHIVAVSPNGPRGDEVLSDKLKDDISNLMLLCDQCHRLIDKAEVERHTVEVLQRMKKDHEDRVERVTGINREYEAHVILYGANIGNHDSPLRPKIAQEAMLPEFYPSTVGPLELGLGNSSFHDHQDEYWAFEDRQLIEKFHQKITPLKESHPLQNFCVFGLAPQPLLIRFGTLLYDLAKVEVFNNQKEPKTWKWPTGDGPMDFFKLEKPSQLKSNIALVFSLSATINDERIHKALGHECSIWKVTIDNPNNDFLKFRNHLSQFRTICRKVLNEIKSAHGEEAVINVFPTMLPSTAIEFGRVWYPKSDLPLVIYDQNRTRGGFIRTIEIGNKR
ncbi:MAG: HNH endonuclease [Flavobacterium sp.]|nr:MAG: HNH endonuclease [Flavobacterium sp.]